MQPNKTKKLTHIRIAKILYLITIALSTYLLYVSRADEIYTIWGVIHPAFLPTFIVATLLLLIIFFSTAKTEHKLLFVIFHSILSHSLMVIMFPAGNIGVQQTILGQTRLVFDNIIYHGLGWAREGLTLQVYVSLRGENLQTAMSVILARMIGVDVYWTHLLLVPILWGTFVPLIAYMITKTLSTNENTAVFAGLIISLFPTTIVWGYASIPNGLSYIFFFCFTYFLLEYLKSNKRKELLLVITFLVMSFVSHYLAGAVAFSFLLLAYSVKVYKEEKKKSPMTANLTMIISFIFAVTILPFALFYRRLFYPTANTYFSLEKLNELGYAEKILTLLIGNYFDFISREAYITTIIFGLAPILGLLGITYILWINSRKVSKENTDIKVVFLFMGLLLIIVDDRIVKLFMENAPFIEADRLWVFRDFLLVPFVAVVTWWAIKEMRFFSNALSRKITSFLHRVSSTRIFSKTFSFSKHPNLVKSISSVPILAYLASLIIISGWVTASVFYSYPHYAPLQTTSYELEAASYIHETTEERYIVITDQWLTFAGQMYAGINNPRAFYFSHADPHGVLLFIQMKTNPSTEIMIEAMKYNNSTVAYFVIAKPRLGVVEYNRIIWQAQQEGIQTYPDGIFYHKGEEKLRIFYYKKANG